MEALLKRSYTLVFPTPALYWLVAGIVMIYLVAAAILAPTSLHLLPRGVIESLLRHSFGFLILLFGIPCGVYLIGWRASDIFAWMRAPRSLELDDEGLRAANTRIAWKDVSAIIEQHQHDRVVLRHRNGLYRLRLNLWSDAEHLHRKVTTHVVSGLLDRVNRQVAAGQSVHFGPLTLNGAGLTHKGRLMRWEEIESIRLQDEEEQGVATRELVIVTQGKLRKIDEAKIVNAPVLLAYLSGRRGD
ncbi:DUF6585 family protein [Vitiosangium sp. GDMCC 1.1324]|uniref:DUF6585 family protein n=1 Tax=Vitiosangium sp. (strain GDMCC 1.1324) TaxID=2138576 RepID=UPI000D333172|nr:DUF6585 family protein [Vitiosangium sp. GDMCC 1.1324]PTL83403.1 hypothetical protein DAT35_15625 [Vitiosangium sp. GDMCC 1.1324]